MKAPGWWARLTAWWRARRVRPEGDLSGVVAERVQAGVLITPFDPATQAALEAYAVVAREDREAMAALAKV